MKKRTLLWITITILCGLSFVGYIIATSSWLSEENSRYQYWASHAINIESASHLALEIALREKAELYIEAIEEDFLLDGMVVGRDLLGNPIEICDSLLFSSLYYVALNKLGFKNKAKKLWSAIEKSQDNGHWFRHPRCKRSTSRDMIMGLLASFSQRPPGVKEHIKKTIAYFHKSGGFISKGRPDISFLTPGVAEFFRIMALDLKLEEPKIPFNIAYAFFTSEFSALAGKRGYTAHLIAIQAWLEMELMENFPIKPPVFRNALIPFNSLKVITGIPPARQRLTWITGQLHTLDPDNLFFKYLRLKAAGALSKATKNLLMSELHAMKTFPDNRLPEDCDRKADYLWQRDSKEYYLKKPTCGRTFSGVDFIWLAALLLEASPPATDDHKAQPPAWD